jgi:uncharacterized Zn finger protein
VDIEGRDKGSDFIFVNSSVNSFDGGRFKYSDINTPKDLKRNKTKNITNNLQKKIYPKQVP